MTYLVPQSRDWESAGLGWLACYLWISWGVAGTFIEEARPGLPFSGQWQQHRRGSLNMQVLGTHGQCALQLILLSKASHMAKSSNI